ncbi:MAG TPA: F0F1 ATP synthase subunit delta [Candidatus Nanopelagicaceae bacterium]
MRVHFGGSSRQSLEIARAKLDAAVKGATQERAAALSSELFFVAEVLGGAISLRRAITDPSRDADSKIALVSDLFRKSLDSVTLQLVSDISTLRWSSSGDLIPVIEQLAIEAEASAAIISNELDRVEDEFFAASRAVADSFELRKALLSLGAEPAKTALVEDLLGEGRSASTIKLMTHLVKDLRGRSIEAAFADYFYALAARRDRMIAHVRVAVEMSATQRERLVSALTKEMGQPVRVNIEVDPTVIGGMSVKFADELVDGTVSHRLAQAGRGLVGQNA